MTTGKRINDTGNTSNTATLYTKNTVGSWESLGTSSHFAGQYLGVARQFGILE
ncbi:9954_t:CDS:2 [Rhizophagus irregularis]|nr:9954_t:CDS:2 [Rhizophagus irregularis]